MKKKTVVSLLLIVAMTAALCLSAAAAVDVSGFTAVSVESGFTGMVTLTPMKADGTAAVSNYGAYMDAVKMNVDYSGAAQGGYYLALALSTDSGVPTESNIQYIDQNTAGGNQVSFTIYPKDLESGMTYYVYLSSNIDGQINTLTKVASFTYVTYRLGDVDGNGVISSNDAVWVMSAAADNIVLDPAQKLAADVNKDGSVDVTDALFILRAVVHLVTIG